MENKMIEMVLKKHPYLSIEKIDGFLFTKIKNERPNILGNFTAADMSYLSNSSAAMQCLEEGLVAQSASMSIEFLNEAKGELLIATAKIIKQGKSLIRLTVNIYIDEPKEENLVAISQNTLSPIKNK